MHLLILGGTTEATALARDISNAGITGIVSFAGRVDRPVRQPLPQRVGGFGGVDGLVAYLKRAKITHVVDATHPFASRMSENARAACAATGTPLATLTRPPWQEVPGDKWHKVPDIPSAVGALERPRARVMLAVGRMTLPEFARNSQHYYLLRLVDPPKTAVPFPDAEVLVSRGPFTKEGDRAVMLAHGIDLVVSKNSGGTGAYAKIAAARALRLPVIMIDRPNADCPNQMFAPEEVLHWLLHTGTDLGV